MLNDAGAGYAQKAEDIFRPEKVESELVLGYFCDSIIPELAMTSFRLLSPTLKCNAFIRYAFQEAADAIEEQADYQSNAQSYEIPDPDLTPRNLSIDRAFRFHKKVDKRDKAVMCSNWSLYEKSFMTRFHQMWHMRIDSYFYPRIITSAHAENVGAAAGRQSASVNLGTVLAPFVINSADAMDTLLNNLLIVAAESGMICDPTKGVKLANGEAGGAAMIMSARAGAWVRKLFRGINTCCGENNVLSTGQIPNPYGIRMYIPPRMPIAQASPRVEYIVLWDTRQVGFPMELLYCDWTEEAHHWTLAGELIYDTHVLDPRGIVVAQVQVS